MKAERYAAAAAVDDQPVAPRKGRRAASATGRRRAMPRPVHLRHLFAFLLALHWLSNSAAGATPADGRANVAAIDCALVRPIFEARNASSTPATIPLATPVDGTSLAVCKAERSCCTSEMESNLERSLRNEYLSSLQRDSQSVQGILASTAIHFQDYVRQMMLKVENRTMRLFRDVFGTEAASTDGHVRHFFAELEQHLNDRSDALRVWGGGDSTAAAAAPPTATNDRFGRATESFFGRLFPYMYQATLTPRNRRQLDGDYKRCLETRMDAIFPAMEAVRGLRRDLSATLEATKALIAALDLGARALNAANVAALAEPSLGAASCRDALLRVAYCGLCAGHAPPVKPCLGYCLNVARGCMAPQAAELDSHWSAFYEALRKLVAVVNRGQSLVCLEDLLRSLLSRIAEPMLNLTEHSEHVHQKAKFVCGQTKWANDSTNGSTADESGADDELGVVRGVTVSRLAGGRADWSMDEDDFNFRSTLLANKIRQFEESVPRSVAFFSNLADAFCREDGFAEARADVACWNGDRIAEYTKTVVSIQMPAQKYNPELAFTAQTSADPRIADIVDRLGRMKRLVQSHIATTPESESPYPASVFEEGSGSGDGRMSPDGVSDDEDALTGWREQGSGSGDLAAVTEVPGSDSDGGPVDFNVSSRTLLEPESPPSAVDGGGVRIGSAASSPPPSSPPAGGATGCASPSLEAVLLFASALLYLAAGDSIS